MRLFSRRVRSGGVDAVHVEPPVRTAVIGLGAMGQRNVEHLKSSYNFDLIGVHDVSREITRKVAGKVGTKPYDSIDSCLSDSDTEAVFVCTPHHLLATIGLKALQANKHLLVEKPMAIDTRSADGLIKLGDELGLLVSVNYSRVFSDTVASARRLIECGAVGELIGVETRWNSYKATGYYYGVHSPNPDDWRRNRDKAGGGMVMMTTCHALQFVPYVTGIKAKTAAAFIPPPALVGEVEDTLQGILQLDCGASWAVLTSSSQRGVAINDTTIWGSNGTVVLKPDRVECYSTRVIEGKKPGAWHILKQHNSQSHFRLWLDDTAQAIRQRKALRVDPESARDTLAIIEALYLSASSGSLSEVR